jgi:hypothetical protein
MTSTEIALHQNGQVADRDVVDGWLSVVSDVVKLANVIAETEFVPEVYRNNAPAVAAAMLTGRELGIGPMTALRHVQMVKGIPTLSAEYKRARVLSAGHEFDVLELNTTRCTVSGRRRGSNKPPLTVTFTMDDARKAGLVKDKGAWHTRPRRMLFARAGSELCDFLFADVVNGLPTTEVMADGAGTDELPEHTAPAAAEPEAPTAKPGTARRKTRTTENPAPAPAPVAPDEPPESGPAAGAGLPPLPGEDEPAAYPKSGAGHAAAGSTPAAGSNAAEAPPDKAPAWVGLIVQHFNRLSITDRDERLIMTTRIAGRPEPVESTKDLNDLERKRVLDTLSRCKDRGQLVALLAEGDKPPA